MKFRSNGNDNIDHDDISTERVDDLIGRINQLENNLIPTKSAIPNLEEYFIGHSID